MKVRWWNRKNAPQNKKITLPPGALSPVWIHSESMSTKTTFALALAAGFLGGIISQHITPPRVFAQSPSPAPKEIRAESFVIVDANGKPRGAFGISEKWGPAVRNHRFQGSRHHSSIRPRMFLVL
jgi:hypothetical protein